MKFVPEFDRSAVVLSIASLLILLYFGLSNPMFFQDYWVAYAFWMTGFTFSFFFLARKSKTATLQSMVKIGFFIAIILLFFVGANIAYASFTEQQIVLADKLVSFAVGVSEELFFGVMLLILLINFTMWPLNNRIFAVLITSGVHSLYHVPKWGQNPQLLILFFVCFAFARSVFVFYYPKIGVLLGAHGFWNLGVS